MAKTSPTHVDVRLFESGGGNVVKSIFPAQAFLGDKAQPFTARLKHREDEIEHYTPTFQYKGKETGTATFYGTYQGNSEIVRVDVIADIPTGAAIGPWKLTFVRNGTTIDADAKAEFDVQP
jgi:hypothetical protein